MTENRKNPSLRLVTSNSVIKQKNLIFQLTDKRPGVEIERKGESSYKFIIIEHITSIGSFGCELSLEICQDRDNLDALSLVCYFPNILCEELYNIIDESETFYGVIMIQFQMKILEHLITFARDQDVSQIIIYVDNTEQGHPLSIYRYITKYEDKIPMANGTKTQLTIPITQETLNKWLSFTRKVKKDFLKTLWSEKADDYLIRNYLISNHSSLVFN